MGSFLSEITVEIYDAEIHEALEGLKAALDHSMAKFTSDLTIYLDNEEAALRLHTGVPTSTSSGQIAKFQTLKKNWETRTRYRVAGAGKLALRWIPSYTNIRKNDRVDGLVRTACTLPTTRTQAFAARASRLIRERYKTEILSYWNTSALERYMIRDRYDWQSTTRVTAHALEKLRNCSHYQIRTRELCSIPPEIQTC